MASPLPDQRAQASAEVPRRLFIPKKLTKRTRGIDFAHQGMSKGRALADACSFLRGTRKRAAPPCRPPRRKLVPPTPAREPVDRDSREAMESSFSRVFPIPPSCRKPLQDGGPTLRKSWLKKRACYDTRALPFRQLPETFFDAPPPHVSSTIGRAPKRMRTDADGWTKTRQFYTPELGKSTARILRAGVSPITPRRPHAHASEISGLEAPTARRRTPKQPLPRPDKHPETAHSPQPQP